MSVSRRLVIRIARPLAALPLVFAMVGVTPTLANSAPTSCPTAFSSASPEALYSILSDFFTLEFFQSLDKNQNDTLCALHIPGIGWNFLDDGRPR